MTFKELISTIDWAFGDGEDPREEEENDTCEKE